MNDQFGPFSSLVPGTPPENIEKKPVTGDRFGPFANLIPDEPLPVPETQGRLGAFRNSLGSGAVNMAGMSISGLAGGKMQSDLNTINTFDQIDQGNMPSQDDFMFGVPKSKDGLIPTIYDARYKDFEQYRDATGGSGFRSEKDVLREKYNLDPRKNDIYEAGLDVQDWAADAMPVDSKYRDDFWTHKIPSGIGSAAAFMAAGVAGRGLGLKGGATASGAGALVGAGGQLQDSLNHGASTEDALQAWQMGSLPGMTEGLPIGQVFNRFDNFTGGTLKRIMKEGLKGGTEEAIQETVQAIGDYLIAAKIVKYDPERGFEGVGENAGVGFTVGALMSMAASALGARRNGRTPPEAPEESGPPPPPPPTAPPVVPPTEGTEDGTENTENTTQGEPVIPVPNNPGPNGNGPGIFGETSNVAEEVVEDEPDYIDVNLGRLAVASQKAEDTLERRNKYIARIEAQNEQITIENKQREEDGEPQLPLKKISPIKEENPNKPIMPFLQNLKEQGGVLTGSPLAELLHGADVDNKVLPGLFVSEKKAAGRKTAKGIDDLVPSEFEEAFGYRPVIDDSGRVDPAWITESLKARSFGESLNPTQEELEIDEVASFERQLFELGLDPSDGAAKIRAVIAEHEAVADEFASVPFENIPDIIDDMERQVVAEAKENGTFEQERYNTTENSQPFTYEDFTEQSRQITESEQPGVDGAEETAGAVESNIPSGETVGGDLFGGPTAVEEREALERSGNGRLGVNAEQQEPGGLFGDERNQTDLVDMINEKPKRPQAKITAPKKPSGNGWRGTSGIPNPNEVIPVPKEDWTAAEQKWGKQAQTGNAQYWTDEYLGKIFFQERKRIGEKIDPTTFTNEDRTVNRETARQEKLEREGERKDWQDRGTDRGTMDHKGYLVPTDGLEKEYNEDEVFQARDKKPKDRSEEERAMMADIANEVNFKKIRKDEPKLTRDEYRARQTSGKNLLGAMVSEKQDTLFSAIMEQHTTQTPNFKRWFGESVVVDEDGNPLVVHHGGWGAADIEEFQAEYGGTTTGNNEHGAFHFTDNLEVAQDYGRQSFIRRYDGNANQMKEDGAVDEQGKPLKTFHSTEDEVWNLAEHNIQTQAVYLRMVNPYILDMKGKQVDVQQLEELSQAFMGMNRGDYTSIPEEAMEIVYEMSGYNKDDVADNREEINQKAIETNDLESIEDAEEWQIEEATRDYMEENGYEEEFPEFDGIIIRNMIDNIGEASNQVADQYIVFEGENIKSVENNGNYNQNDARIHKSGMGMKPGRNWVGKMDPVDGSRELAIPEKKGVIARLKEKFSKPGAVQRQTIGAQFLKDIGRNVFYGHIASQMKASGFYRPGTKEVRVDDRGNIETLGHEIAHQIDYDHKEVRAKTKTHKDELLTLSYDDKNVKEGFAEFVRFWLTDKEIAKQGAPEFYAWFEGWVDGPQSKQYGKALRTAQESMTGWFDQSALTRAKSKVGQLHSQAQEYIGSKFRQGVIDDLHGIEAAEKKLFGQAKADGMYETARLSRGVGGILEGAIRFGAPQKLIERPGGPLEKGEGIDYSETTDGLYGYNDLHFGANRTVFVDLNNNPATIWRNGKLITNPNYQGGGLEVILKDVADDLEHFGLYAIGRRAKFLMGQGREKLFSKQEIEAMLELETPERLKAFAEWNKFNKQVLNYAQSSGIINAESREQWETDVYLPFWRVDKNNRSSGAFDGNVIKQLKGGKSNLQDPVANMFQNVKLLIHAAVVNDAKRKVIRSIAVHKEGGALIAKVPKTNKAVYISPDQVKKEFDYAMSGVEMDDDTAEAVAQAFEGIEDFIQFWMHGQEPKGDDLVSFLSDGKITYYQVSDPVLLKAIKSMPRLHNSNPVVRTLKTIKNISQFTITTTISFLARNLGRDTIMSAVLSKHGFKPFIDSAKGMKHRLTQDEVYKEYLAGGGAISGFFHDENDMTDHLEAFYVKHKIPAKMVIHSPKAFARLVQHISEAGEAAGRLGEAGLALRAGKSQSNASFEAREIGSDFNMRGSNEVVGFFFDTVMFLKAGVIGMDRVYRGLATDVNKKDVAKRIAIGSALSVGLYLVNAGNPAYDDLEDWEKDIYWHFFIPTKEFYAAQNRGDDMSKIPSHKLYHHYRYPKPWEVGGIMTLAELSVHGVINEDPKVAGRMLHVFREMFRFNLIPQALAPIEEQRMGRTAFMDRPIEGNLEDLQPWARSSPYGSRTLRAIGESTRKFPRDLQFNPARAEALMQGYFNSWAAYGLTLADAALFDDNPSLGVESIPGVAAFMKSGPGRKKHATEFYDALREATEVRKTQRSMDKSNRAEYGDELFDNPINLKYERLTKANTDVRAMNSAMIEVLNAKGLVETRKLASSYTLDPGLKKRVDVIRKSNAWQDVGDLKRELIWLWGEEKNSLMKHIMTEEKGTN